MADEKLDEMPTAIFGTMEYLDGSEPSILQEATQIALETGYRHLDCAEVYQTSTFVGQAIAASAVQREELFITTKLKGMTGSLELIKSRLEAHLADLQLEYVDLLLIHFPGDYELNFDANPEEGAALCLFAEFPERLQQIWPHYQALREAGLARRIGVSNFYQSHLEEFEALGLELPFANQIYVDPVHPENELVAYMLEKGIRPIGYRPLAFFNVYEMVEAMGIDVNTRLNSLAEKTDLSSRSMFISVLNKRGLSVVAKSRSAEHLKDNLDASSGANADAISDEILAEVCDLGSHAEMVDMMGGADEYALMFKRTTQ